MAAVPEGDGVRTARPEDAPALRAIFREVFGESEAGLDLFFSRAFAPERTVVAACGGAVRGMFFILPASLRCGGVRLKAAYLYALAVTPAYRSRGLGGAMLRFLDGLLPRMGYAAAVLRPAEASLYGYYRRFGYGHAFLARERLFAAGGAPPRCARAVPCPPDALPGGRDSLFPRSDPLFCWGPGMLRYAADYAALCGGGSVRLWADGFTGYALYRREGDALAVEDFGGEAPGPLIGALLRHTGARTARAALPVALDPLPGDTVAPQALLRWFIPPRPTEGGHFALGLD